MKKILVIALALFSSVVTQPHARRLYLFDAVHEEWKAALLHGFTQEAYNRMYIMPNAIYFDKPRLDFCEQLYAKNNLTKVMPQATPKIPKIIHQVWVGGPVPEKYKNFQKTWKKYNPDWVYKLWTDEDIESFGMWNKDLFDRAQAFAEKADIWRYEIIYRYGGVYADMDFECIKPLDIFNHCYDFYAGIEPLGGPLRVNNAFFAASPGHPILKECVESVRRNCMRNKLHDRTGPTIFFDAFCAIAPTCVGNVIVFPPSYFYPVLYSQHSWPQHEKVKIFKPESYAAHHWGSSWFGQE